MTREKFLRRFRVVNGVIAIAGLLLLVWLFDYMRHSAWDSSTVIVISAIYYVIQLAPVLYVARLGFKLNNVFRRSWPEAKRKATLQRRGLFDFVSPFAVFLAIGGYLAIVPFIVLVQEKPFPGYQLLGVLTLTYLMQGAVIYHALYGKKMNPLETPELRAHRIGMTAKTGVYGLIVVTIFFAFVFLVDKLEMKHWVPLAQTFCLLFSTGFCLMGVSAPPEPGARPGSTPSTTASHH